MKGIVLAGGSGTRLYPITSVVSKQLTPVYDKPMIYYPISTLLMAGIREILIISTPRDRPLFEHLLKDGSSLGCKFSYAEQENPNGIAEAFVIGEEFIDNKPVALVLGDNIFHGEGLMEELQTCVSPQGGIIFAYRVVDPERYGVVEFDQNQRVISIEEKPTNPKTDYAIPGLYFFNGDVAEVAKSIKPSARGELEITEINRHYLDSGNLEVRVMGRGTAWLDTGTFGSLMQAANFVQIIEERQGLKIGCIEEVAYRMKYIDRTQLENLARPLMNSGYGEYLMKIIS